MNKIYFAGFDVCSPETEIIRRKYQAVCAKYGYKAIFPISNRALRDKYGESLSTPLDESRAMFEENLRRIDSANIVIANLGYSFELCTNNTAFEIGYAHSKHKQVIGYRDVEFGMRFYNSQEKIAFQSVRNPNRPPANLMVVCAMPVIIQGELEDCLDWILKDPLEENRRMLDFDEDETL